MCSCAATAVRTVLKVLPLWLSMHLLSMHDCIPILCERDILQTARDNFTKLKPLLHLGQR